MLYIFFFKYNENNEYTAGPIFDGIEIPRVKINNLLDEALNIKIKIKFSKCVR